jgi:hypothetical protein
LIFWNFFLLLWVKNSSAYQGKEFHANFELIKASVMLKSNAHLASIHTQVPTYGIFENISSISQLAAMPQWTEDRPLRVVTGYTYLGQKFLQENGLKHVQILTADGALEAAPAVSIYLEQ